MLIFDCEHMQRMSAIETDGWQSELDVTCVRNNLSINHCKNKNVKKKQHKERNLTIHCENINKGISKETNWEKAGKTKRLPKNDSHPRTPRYFGSFTSPSLKRFPF